MDATEPAQVRLEVLGETRLFHADSEVRLSPARRRVLAALHVAGNAGVSSERLAELVWSQGAPVTASQSLANHLSWLRRRLPTGALTTRSGGHRLRHDRMLVDADVLLDAVAEIRAGARRVDLVLPGLPMRAYASLGDDDLQLDLARRRLAEAAAELHEHQAWMALDQGDLDAAGERFATLVEVCPGRDGVWTGLVHALARSGRRVEALATCRRAYRFYTDELGLDLPRELASLQASVLTAGTPTPRETSDAGVRLVGRGELVEQLLGLLERRPLVVLRGSIGLGKTVLVDQLVAHRSGGVHACYRVSGVRNPWQPFAPLVQLAEQLPPSTGARSAPPSPSLSAPGTSSPRTPGWHEDEASVMDLAALQRWHHHLTESCRRAAAQRTALLVIVDDAHRAGPASLRLLAQMVEQVPQLRLLLVTRDEQLLAPDVLAEARTVALPPFRVDEVAELLRRRFAADGRPWRPTGAWLRWVDELHADTAGNPWAVSLLLDALYPGTSASSPLAGSDAGHARPVSIVPTRWRTTPAPYVDEVELLLRTLSQRQRRVLDGLVVLGGRATPAELAELTGDGDVAEAERAELVERDAGGEIVFRSPLLLRAVMALVPAGRRAELLAVRGLPRRRRCPE